MKNLLRGATVLLLFLASGALAASLVHSTDAATVTRLLKKLGYRAVLENNGTGTTQVRVESKDGKAFYLYFFDDDRSRGGYEGLQLLSCADAGGEFSGEALSYWNQTHRYAKVYLDESGAVCLQSDLDLRMGVVLEPALKQFLNDFLESYGAYELELVGQ
ncbi:YbjN domain-containing protein [Oceanithermus sp.]